MTVRFSRIIAQLRAKDGNELADKLEASQKVNGANCKVHGKLEDPVMVLALKAMKLHGPLGDEFQVPEGGDVVFACPFCCGEDVLEEWQREGAQN